MRSDDGWYPAWFAGVTLDAVRTEPVGINKAVTTNLVAPMSLTRLALAFIGASPAFSGESTGFVPSVVYTSSLSGLTPTPGMTMYSATKHGLVGLARSMPLTDEARFNVVCPSATDTGLLPDVVKGLWRGAGGKIQSAEDIARISVHCVAGASLDRRAVVIACGESWEAEEELDKVKSV